MPLGDAFFLHAFTTKKKTAFSYGNLAIAKYRLLLANDITIDEVCYKKN